MTRPGRMMDNARAKEIYAGMELGKACAHCRFYDESLRTDLAVCRKHKIRTNIAASCRDYDRKVPVAG